MELQSAIQAIVIEDKLRCGYRRVTAEQACRPPDAARQPSRSEAFGICRYN